MPKNKNIPIKYTNRDFDTIKQDLIDYAKRYYPDTYKDFSEASFGAMVFDMIAYVGDNISFYLDYQANESFLDTAVEFANIRKHARSLGYSFSGVPVSYGLASFFILVPANADGNAPDSSYMPTLKKNTSLRSASGVSFLLLEDVDFSDSKNEVVEAQYNSTDGGVTYYAIRAYGQVSSGKLQSIDVNLINASFEKFRKVRIGSSAISEVVKVVDSEGNVYYEVDYLSQETIMIETTNPTAQSDGVRSIMKPFVTARRFVMEQDNTGTYLQFGFGSEDDDDSGLADPSAVALNLHARDAITATSIDPSKLVGTDKFGISPFGTTLKVIYRVNDSTNVNVGANQLDRIISPILKFNDPTSLDSATTSFMQGSLEVTNENPIVGQTVEILSDELKVRAKNYYATQNRAVTKKDYESIAYNMPNKFGSIKRVNVINDPMATNRKLALYVVSENENAQLVVTNSRIKENLKAWLTQYKSINDQIEIFDAKIVNFGIDFEVSVDNRYSRDEVITNAINNLSNKYSQKLYIGEPIYLTDIYNILVKTTGIIDVKKLKIFNKYGGNYSSTPFDFDKVVSRDGSFYKIPKNVIVELKFPNEDIKGAAK
jgi:hypothetical protein